MKNRILFIMHMPPPVHGAAMMGQYIHDSRVVNNEFECDYVNLSASKQVDSVGRLQLSKIFFFFLSFVQIVRKVYKFNPKLCYYTPTTTGFGLYRDAAVIGMLRMMNKKIVLHLHNKGASQYANSKWYAILYKIIFKGQSVILLSEQLYSDISKFVEKQDLFICPNGIPEETSLCKKTGKEITILFFSNLISSKGVWVLLDACEKLKKENISFRCIVAGGESKEITKRIFEEGVRERDLEGYVCYKGKLFGKDKTQCYMSADIFAFPTFFPGECFPVVLLEAMQHQLPIVTTNEGAIGDIVQEGVNGLICKQEDVESLVSCLKILICSEEQRNNMGVANYKKYKREYTLDVFEKNIVSILKRCIDE